MHPVIEKIVSRRNAQTPPKDKEKLFLFVLGGITAAVRSAGALLALEVMGFTNAFDAVYAFSAGFANSCYFLTGQTKTGISVYYDKLNTKKFINKFHPWHLLNMDYIINIIKHEKPLDLKKLYQSKTKLYAGMRNFKTKQTVYKEIHEHSQKNFFQIFKATTSMPFFVPGKVKIGSGKYKDYTKYNFQLNEHIDLILKQNPTGILIICNDHYQARFPAFFSEKIFEIIPQRDWVLSHIETNPNILKFEAEKMKNLVLNIFNRR